MVIISIVSVLEKAIQSLYGSKKKRTKSKTRYAKNQLETMATGFSLFSIKKTGSAVDVSPTLLYHILHDDLHLKLYKYQEWHKFEEYYYGKRV